MSYDGYEPPETSDLFEQAAAQEERAVRNPIHEAIKTAEEMVNGRMDDFTFLLPATDSQIQVNKDCKSMAQLISSQLNRVVRGYMYAEDPEDGEGVALEDVQETLKFLVKMSDFFDCVKGEFKKDAHELSAHVINDFSAQQADFNQNRRALIDMVCTFDNGSTVKPSDVLKAAMSCGNSEVNALVRETVEKNKPEKQFWELNNDN